MKLVASLILKHLLKKAMKSATAAVAVGGAAAGTAVVVDPQILDAVPEQYRGYIFLGIAALTLIARFRGEFAEMVAELKKDAG